MNKQQSAAFSQEDSVTTRRNFGEFLDQVEKHSKRWIITKRGHPVALLVPLSDREAIEKHAQTEQLEQVYSAIDAMSGLIENDERSEDPNG